LDDHACGFVDDDQVFVFEDHIERDVFGEGVVIHGLADGDVPDLAEG